MNLLELLQDLTYGELAALEMGKFIPGEPESQPDPTSYAQLTSHINLGLKEIYKRFFLLSREIYIELREETSIYMLHSKYAQTNTDSLIPIEDRYIMDTDADPFTDDCLKIEEVYDEAGVHLPMNDINEETSIHTPSYRTIQVPYPNDDITYAVQYRACNTKIEYTADMDPSMIDLPVPNSLHEALLYYVASRAYTSLGGDGGIEGNDYFQRFENSCAKVSELGLEVQTEPVNWRFDENGWV
jgi:hypothetical protein